MQYHWLEDRIKNKEIQVLWKPGKTNKGDYFTKHHPPSHHRKMCPYYLPNAIVEQLFNRNTRAPTLPARVC